MTGLNVIVRAVACALNNNRSINPTEGESPMRVTHHGTTVTILREADIPAALAALGQAQPSSAPTAPKVVLAEQAMVA